MKRIIKDYLYFSKQERIAVIVLLALMGLFIAAPYLYPPKFDPPVINQALTDWLSANHDSSAREDPVVIGANQPVKLFPFDPNTVSESEWLRLGIPGKTTRTILNYRNKGGKFRKPDDVRKIWGMSNADAERLIPYISIAAVEGFAKTSFARNDPVHTANKKVPANIDINTAGLTEWGSLPGIGDVLANRIIRYREKTGVFRSVEQVAKTYGISDSLFQNIRQYLRYDPVNAKLNLNTASAYALSQAGIDYRLSRDLVRYREQNGPYKSLDQLHQLVEMPDSAWQKLLLLIKIE